MEDFKDDDRFLKHLKLSMNSSISSNFEKQGLIGRPKGQDRCKIWNTIDKKKGGWYVKNVKGNRAVQRDQATLQAEQNKFIAAFGSSAVVEAMKVSEIHEWNETMFTGAAKFLMDLPVPRVSLDALQGTLEDSPFPIALIIDDMEKGSTATDISYHTFERVIWSNKADMEWWDFQSEEERQAFLHRKKNCPYIWNTYNAIIDSLLEDGDVQPKRHEYYKLGSAREGDFDVGTAHICENIVLLVECEGVVHAGLLYNLDAPLKYDKEMQDLIVRAHAIFRYTESALAVFTYGGAIVQQNPLSMTYLGVTSSTNVMYTDVDKDGKPVDRLRALFGDNEALYDEMFDAILEGDHWQSRMKIFKHNLKPFKGIDLTEARDMDPGMWIHIQVGPFVDPTDAQRAIFVSFKDISKIVEQEQKVREAKKQEHEILESIIPAHIIKYLTDEKRNQSSLKKTYSSGASTSDDFLSLSAVRNASDLAEHHDNVTILFTDIVGFTKMSSQCTPAEIMGMLNDLFTLFDKCTDDHGIYKVETIGDAYMCVAGLNLKSKTEEQTCEEAAESHAIQDAQHMLSFAKEILNNMVNVKSPVEDPLQIRVGMHSGECMTGVVGLKMPRFCLFGDTVNTASRMESNGKPGYIHASKVTRDLLPDEAWVATGGIEAKGKGMMETYLLKP